MAFCGACCAGAAEETVQVDTAKAPVQDAQPVAVSTPAPAPIEAKVDPEVKEAKPSPTGKQASRYRDQEMFNVEIDVDGKKLGIDINYHDGQTLLITKVNEGPVMDYNRSHMELPCLVGDRFVKINDESGEVKKILEAVKREPVLKGEVRRALEKVIHIVKHDDKDLGIETVDYDLLTVALADDPAEGTLLAEHNEIDDDFAMKKDDYIVCVNGVSGEPAKIAAALKEGDAWEITFRRIERKKGE
jgi:hypothetical protein